ncbi:MAG: phosphoserine phosphatase SerB [Pseudoclavibacter sp.]|nr:phosphoserine phosphatase SerB [Pseudoclavibacter sp.]
MSPSARFLVVLDVDSTLIEQEVIELIAAVAGVEEEVARITERAMRGELDFSASLRSRVALLRDVPLSELAAIGERLRLTAGAQELIDAVHAADGRIAAVSGGFHEVLDPLAERIGLDRWRANRLEVREGLLTGALRGPVIGRTAKLETLREWTEAEGLPIQRTVAIGDGANDLGMMSAAGLSVAFAAKPIVRAQASVSMPERDLRQVLPLLGLA